MEEYVLVHHGTKGMRWGVRRYQNKDGSLTPAGRERYGDGMSDDHVRARSKPSSSMTDKELQDAVQRLQREKMYADLTAPKKSAGLKFIGKFLERLGDKAIEKTVNTIGDKIFGPSVDTVLGKATDKAVAGIGRSAKGRKFMRNWGISTERRVKTPTMSSDRKKALEKLSEEFKKRK